MGRTRWAGGMNRFVLASIWALSLSAAAQANTVAGELAGEFAVTAQGAASYRIPIAVPPGVAGMAPQLALAYNSQGGNGLLGVGWSLEGLSSMSRCPASLVTDGHIRGVRYDEGDRFCLDGQNLISANGLYATAGAEYRTERENFSRIRSYGAASGSAANGPAYFVVQTKAGLTLEYGKTEDARIQAQGKSVVRAWAVNAMVDAKGNRIEFKYAEDTAAGTHRLSQISYAGRSVRFVYEARPDPIVLIQVGSAVTENQRLKAIETYIGGALVQRTEIAYSAGPTSGQSRIASVRQCAADGSCLQPLAFEINDANAPTGVLANYHHSLAGIGAPINGKPKLADIDGDGQPDLYALASNVVYMWRGLGNGHFQAGKILLRADDALPSTNRPAQCETHVADHNGDGISDLLLTCETYSDDFESGNVGYSVSAHQWLGQSGGGYSAPRSALTGWISGLTGHKQYTPHVLDLNGDGLVDILYVYKGVHGLTAYRWLGQVGGSFGPAVNVTNLAGDWSPYQLHTTDLNQDGVTDLVYTRSVGGRFVLYVNFGDRAGNYGPLTERFHSAQFGALDDHIPYLVDTNADGIPDLLYVRANASGASAYVWLGSGNGYFTDHGKQALMSADFGSLTGYRPQPIDINGDGLIDLAFTFPGATNVNVYHWLGRGDGRFDRGQRDLAQVLTVGSEPFFTDLNQDGAADLLMVGVNSSSYDGEGNPTASRLNIHRWLGQGAGQPDRLSAITTGSGARHEISYAPLTDKAVYTKDSGNLAARYPFADVIAPLWVVSASAQSNGLGGMNRSRYTYGGLKLEHASAPGVGRGLLGYRWMRSAEDISGIETYREYRQDWPYVGQLIKSETRLAGHGHGGLLKQSLHYHDCYLSNAANTTTACYDPAPGLSYFAYEGLTQEHSWDLNGAPLPSITTSTSYYGGTVDTTGQARLRGDVLAVQVTITHGGALKSRQLTANTYHPAKVSGDAWISGRLARSTVTSHRVDSPLALNTLTRTSAFTYDAQGLLIGETIEPDRPQDCLQTTYTYDAYGNRASAATSACAGASGHTTASASTARIDTSRFDTQIVNVAGISYTTPAGIFASASTNALGHSEARRHDPRHGGRIALTGPNHLTTTWTYDPFGRKTEERRADGTRSAWQYRLCAPAGQSRDSVCPIDIGGAAVHWYALERTLSASGADMTPPKWQFYDQLGRVVRVQTLGFDGQGAAQTLVQDTHYNAKGQIAQRSIIHPLAGGAPRWTTYTYDPLGRIASETVPDGAGVATTVFTHNGLHSAITNPKGQTQNKQHNANGQIERITDPLGQAVTYTYDALGQLIETNAAGAITRLSYDQRGRKIKMDDPAMGVWNYAHNAFGELVWQSDSLGQITTLAYDKLGRLIKRSEPDLISDWSYDKKFDGTACGKGMGKLCEAKSNNGYRRLHSYDSLGRPVSTQTALDSATVLATVSQTYEAGTGRLASQTWPTGYKASTTYTPLGYLKTVSGAMAGDTRIARLEVLAVDPQGRITQYRQGSQITTVKNFDAVSGRLESVRATAAGQASGNLLNHSYTYDALGNLLGRQDANTGLIESFAYDGLNRLIQTTAQGGGLASAQAVQLIYDARGNIQYKSDVGYYNYDPQRPNRLAQITLTQPSTWAASAGVAVPNSGTRALTYAFDDARAGAKTNSAGQRVGNGNLWYTVSQDHSTGRHTVRWETYTSFNAPKEIKYGNLTTPANPTAATADRTLSFLYGPEHQRIKQTLTKTSNAPSSVEPGTTWYLNGENSQSLTYEKDIKASGLIEHKHFLSAGGITFALYVKREGALGGKPPTSLHYWHHDHLGSLAVISSDTGTLVERLAFDAWGKRRHINGTADRLDALHSPHTDRGYTLHEHLDEVGVIHMNGRIYDPLIGRFMSADPFIQSPENLQSHNRYAYVLNNPLAFTDPSGYFSLKGFLKATIKAILLPSLKNTFNWIASMPGQQYIDNLILRNPTLNAIGQAAATIFTMPICGGCGGTLWATYYTYRATGSMNAGLRAGLRAEVSLFVSSVGFGMAGDVGETFGRYSAAHFAGHAAVGCATSEIGGGSCATGALSGMTGLAGTPYGYVGAIVSGGVGAVVGGGKFVNGAVTAGFGYLFNYCAHNGCWTTPEERAHLDRGDFRSYYTEACRGGDLNACRFYGIATGEEPGPSTRLRRDLMRRGYSFKEVENLVTNAIPLNLAKAYANMLPQSEALATFPSAHAIAQYHWVEFERYGLPPSTFGGTPFGKSFGVVLPRNWCPLCR